MNIFKKYPQSTVFTAALIILVLNCVLGWSFSEYAKTPFWWNFWAISAVVSAILFVALIVWAVVTQKKFDE